MVVARVVLSDVAAAVVVAVRRAHDRMDMVARRLAVREHDAGLMVELDEHHRAVDAVVERRVIVVTADP